MEAMITARIAAEGKVKLSKEVEVSAEDKKKALDEKITVDIEARKALADDAIAALSEKKAKESAEQDLRWKKLEDERLAAVALIESKIAAARETKAEQ